MASRDAMLEIGGFRHDLRYSQDWECWLRLAPRGAVWCSTRVESEYLVRPDSHSRDTRGVLAVEKEIFDRFAPNIRAIDPRAITIARSWLAVAAADAARGEGQNLRA